MTPGTVVLVPFPFTDLSGTKRRPALVVSPNGFHPDDVLLCAVTSRVPASLGPWEVALSTADLTAGTLPKPSVVRVGKLFTMHGGLIVGQVGHTSTAKLAEVRARLRQLFAA